MELNQENNLVTRSDGWNEKEGLKWAEADREQG